MAAALSASPLNIFHIIRQKNCLELKEWAEKFAKPDSFPINQPVFKLLAEAGKSGNKVWLATASPDFVANAVAKRLRLFDGVLASGNGVNLKGVAKAQALVRKFGLKGFDYIGDSPADEEIWKVCRRAYVMGNKAGALQSAQNVNSQVIAIPQQKTCWRDVVYLLRVRQWVKNLLVFLPLLLSHTLSLVHLCQAICAFFALCFCASAIYVINDICDLNNDRLHPVKKKRPLASGNVPLAWTSWLIGASFLLSGAFTFLLPGNFAVCLVLYLAVTIAYSFYFKRLLFLDVLLLAGLYVLRIILGAAATGLIVSNWLLGFSSFLFLGLALVKRLGAIRMQGEKGKIYGRGWIDTDLPVVTGLATGSGLCSIVIMILYVDSLQAEKFYRQPEFLWLMCPVILWWYCRMLILANRGELEEDPVAYAVRDKASWVAFGLCCLFMIISL